MAGRQAKILTDAQVERMLAWCDGRRYPLRDRVIVLLSVKAGLRAMEIAGLRWHHVTDAVGAIDDVIHLEDKICKKGSGRTIPMHQLLSEALRELRTQVGGALDWPVIRSERFLREDPTEPGTGRVQCMTPRSVVQLFQLMYEDLGFTGCSSHSGRRTFITRAARKITTAGGSLRDVQQLAGHGHLTTTQRYIEGDTAAKRRVIELI